MSAGKVIYARLTAGTPGASLSTRVFPAQAEQNTATPYVVYEEFDGERESAMGSDIGIVRALVRVNLYVAKDAYVAGEGLFEAIRAQLQRFRGTAGGVTVDDIFIVPGSPKTFDDLLGQYNFQRDFEVIYRE